MFRVQHDKFADVSPLKNKQERFHTANNSCIFWVGAIFNTQTIKDAIEQNGFWSPEMRKHETFVTAKHVIYIKESVAQSIHSAGILTYINLRNHDRELDSGR